ncbi:MAG TPA: type II secretion system F family protein [Phycisphaerae bacterium]|nr:type II secretion system F family protein [Phycisphaerae bacterium]HRW55303.1 type II secretion system F family protein [Phycisphaerae bacterium]
MPSFSYVARTIQGQTVSGVIAADSQQQALRSLDEQALFPVEVREGGKAGTGDRRKKVSSTSIAVFYSQFADLLRAGVPALRSLDVLYKQTHNVVLKEVLKEVREDIASGQTLADAMDKHHNAFSALHVSMVRAGEKGGFLEEVLSRIAIFTERQNELRNKVLGSMLYPAVLMMVGGGVLVFLLMVVVPQVRGFLQTDKLPGITIFVFSVCDLLNAYGYWILGGILMLGALITGFFRSETGRFYMDRMQLKAPLVGSIFVLVAICRFCRILGTLLKNGVPILQSLKISQDSAGNMVLADVIEDATESVRKGATLSKPLGNSKLFPLDIVDMIAIGEESNNLENVLVTIADSYEARTGRKIDLAVRMLEPLLLVMMAGVVAVIAIALLLPILTMSAGGI